MIDYGLAPVPPATTLPHSQLCCYNERSHKRKNIRKEMTITLNGHSHLKKMERDMDNAISGVLNLLHTHNEALGSLLPFSHKTGRVLQPH